MKGVMPDSRLNEAERGWQRRFSFAGFGFDRLLLLLLVTIVLSFALWSTRIRPDRIPMAPRSAALRAEPIMLAPDAAAPLRLVGAWRLSADDPRFVGLSALVLTKGRLLAPSDSGGLFRFDFPGPGSRSVAISELPAGPGSPRFKENRDSEALAADSSDGGWWVAFETRNEIWHFDAAFRRPTERLLFGRKRWPVNLGIEAMVADGDRLTLIPELAHEVVTVVGGKDYSRPLTGVCSKISDAVRLPDGKILVLMREVGLTGFRNALGILVERTDGWHVEQRVPLRVGALVNLEGLAVERRPGGAIRLWLVSDDNFQRPLETVLVALDLPPGGWPGRKD